MKTVVYLRIFVIKLIENKQRQASLSYRYAKTVIKTISSFNQCFAA